jgi:hypothetical protein
VEAPLLSIAIPSFGRPGALGELLESVAKEVAGAPAGLVEVCITDDASISLEAVEVALAFAERHPYASLRIRPNNVGLERNVLGVGEPCRGGYLLIVGNDDILLPGALETILEDIEVTSAPVLLYAKHRINSDGSPRDEVPGSIPIDLEADGTHLFPTLIDAAREQGLLSTFGYLGPIVMRREPFMAVDPTPYLDLTMYAPLWVMVEAFSSEAVFYRNRTTILHRTPSPTDKHAEALGRREEEFMTGGRARRSRYFGTALAATLQRLVDRAALERAVLATLPERLNTELLLVDWIAGNRGLDPTMENRLSASVVEDANRFFADAPAASVP